MLLASARGSLRQQASGGGFLADLAFRLSAIRFSLPPLRERREDIVPLAQALLERICIQYRQPTAVLAAGTLSRLLQHSWPGNVSELKSVLESAVQSSKTGILQANDLLPASQGSGTASCDPNNLPREIRQPAAQSSFSDCYPITNQSCSGAPDPARHSGSAPQTLTLSAAVSRHIQYVLNLNRGNKLRTARQLDISRSTLYRILAGEEFSPSSKSGSTPGKK
jgi:two-component system response regulator AtoC